MTETFSGIVNSFIAVHLENALSQILSSPSGRITSCSFPHSANAKAVMLVIPSDNTTFCRPELAKASLPMFVTFPGMVISCNAEHPVNAWLPMEVRLFGRTTEESFVQFAKADSLILVTVLGSFISEIFIPLNAAYPIFSSPSGNVTVTTLSVNSDQVGWSQGYMLPLPLTTRFPSLSKTQFRSEASLPAYCPQ